MKEIKVGEYIRTKDGIIAKVTYKDCSMLDTDNDVFTLEDENYNGYDFFQLGTSQKVMEIPIEEVERYVKKHSFNIIDLIEEGDYVNGYKVLEIAPSIYEHTKRIMIYRNEKESFERWIYIQEYDGKIHTQDDIKSIVTKEQFKAMEYEVK